MRTMSFALAAVCAVALAAPAGAAGKGASMLSLGLGQGTAETYSAVAGLGAGDYLAPGSAPETNVGVEYWYQFSDDYAFALSGAYGFSSQQWKSSTDPADGEVKATGSSFKARIGGDRIGKVGDRLLVFMGPGIEFWNGKSKVELGGTEAESESITRYGVSGRIGGIMMLSDAVGIQGQVGHTFGMASVEDSGAESTWMPSSFNASWGLTFAFGGGQ